MRSLFSAQSLIFLSAAAVTSAFFINLCATVFRCGCLWLWAGADAACNIHRANTPHCPWCQHNPYIPYAAIVIAQGIACFWPARLPLMRRAAIAFALFPTLGGAIAVAYGAASGYWNS